MAQIKIRYNKKTGKLEIETVGFEGDECLKATAGLEKALGIDPSKVQLTPEYFQEKTEDSIDVLGGE